MKLNAIEFPEDFFTRGDNYELVSEASDMQNRHLQRIGGSLEAGGGFGFAVKMTDGKLVTFLLTDAVKVEGEVTAWEYKGSDGSQALVFND
jgi:hypothetical protein